uniref:Uncharacterized protein n=1 Tax=Arundo donax TaxID=35708 RepID=A0A0A9D8A9_ARUDO
MTTGIGDLGFDQGSAADSAAPLLLRSSLSPRAEQPGAAMAQPLSTPEEFDNRIQACCDSIIAGLLEIKAMLRREREEEEHQPVAVSSPPAHASHCTCRPRASSSVLQAAVALARGRCGSEGYAPPLLRRTAVRRGAAQDGAERRAVV